MKLRMADNSLFAILLRSRWWVSAALCIGIGAVAAALLPAQWRIAGALSGFPFGVIAVLAAWRQRHAPSAARVAEVDAAVRALAWPAFAALLEASFRRDGHAVRRLDGGADFELQRQGRTLLVAARRFKSARTGLEPLRELQAARDAAGADALYIGLGELGEPAAAFAKQHGITLWQAGDLARALRGLPLPAAGGPRR